MTALSLKASDCRSQSLAGGGRSVSVVWQRINRRMGTGAKAGYNMLGATPGPTQAKVWRARPRRGTRVGGWHAATAGSSPVIATVQLPVGRGPLPPEVVP